MSVFLLCALHLTQEDVCKTEFAANVPFKVISAIFNFYIPTVCMVVIYVRWERKERRKGEHQLSLSHRIFLAIRRRSREMERITGIAQGKEVGRRRRKGGDDCSSPPASCHFLVSRPREITPSIRLPSPAMDTMHRNKPQEKDPCTAPLQKEDQCSPAPLHTVQQ
jgi:hypothetical protein